MKTTGNGIKFVLSKLIFFFKYDITCFPTFCNDSMIACLRQNAILLQIIAYVKELMEWMKTVSARQMKNASSMIIISVLFSQPVSPPIVLRAKDARTNSNDYHLRTTAIYPHLAECISAVHLILEHSVLVDKCTDEINIQDIGLNTYYQEFQYYIFNLLS